MKQKVLKIISLVLILCCVFIFAGCDENNAKEQENTSNTEQTTASETASDNPLMGTWQFVNENGENQTLLSYVFKDDKTAVMAMGNVAFCAELKLDKNESGKDTLNAQLYYNINGTYVYEISDDGKTLTITEDGTENGETQTMKKVEDYKFMPDPPENPEIDEKLIGTWQEKEGTGVTYTFFENGTMENNSYDVMMIYAQYSAKNGKLSYTYNQGTDMSYSYDYSFDGDVLTIDNIKFVKA